MIFALIKNEQVKRVIKSNQTFADSVAIDYDFVINVTDFEELPTDGWSYINGIFTKPLEPEPPEPKPREALLERLEYAKANFDTLTNNQKDKALEDLIRVALHYIKAD